MKMQLLILASLALATSTAAEPLTFTEDIAPILEQRCVECHREGQMAPMALTSFEEVRPWVKAIQREVAARRMPPFNVEGELGRYKNDIRLPQSELDAILGWIDAGAPKGPGNETIDTSRFTPGTGWEAETPDRIVTFPEVRVPADIGDAYLLLYGEPVFDEAVWVERIEWNIGNAKVVHHIVPYFIDATAPVPADGISSVVNMDLESRVKGFGAGYLPGMRAFTLPESEALLIPAGTRVVAEMHYAAADTSQSDVTRLGFRYANGTRRPAEPLFHIPVPKISIEPGQPDYTRVESKRVSEDLWARGFRFHMHLRGKSGRLDLRYPDGREELLIAVPQYDFNWQHLYELNEPILLPAGAEVILTEVWDNSKDNPHNPNPAERVRAGSSTNDEMGSASIFVSKPEGEATWVQLRGGREVESGE